MNIGNFSKVYVTRHPRDIRADIRPASISGNSANAVLVPNQAMSDIAVDDDGVEKTIKGAVGLVSIHPTSPQVQQSISNLEISNSH